MCSRIDHFVFSWKTVLQGVHLKHSREKVKLYCRCLNFVRCSLENTLSFPRTVSFVYLCNLDIFAPNPTPLAGISIKNTIDMSSEYKPISQLFTMKLWNRELNAAKFSRLLWGDEMYLC